MRNKKVYLGDSVYAFYDGYHIVLTTENGLYSDPSNTIALESSVLNKLTRFKDEIFEWIENESKLIEGEKIE